MSYQKKFAIQLEAERLYMISRINRFSKDAHLTDIVLIISPVNESSEEFDVNVLHAALYIKLGSFVISSGALVHFKTCVDLMRYKTIFSNVSVDNPIKLMKISNSMEKQCEHMPKTSKKEEVTELFRAKNFFLDESPKGLGSEKLQHRLKSALFESSALSSQDNVSIGKLIYSRKSVPIGDTIKSVIKQKVNTVSTNEKIEELKEDPKNFKNLLKQQGNDFANMKSEISDQIKENMAEVAKSSKEPEVDDNLNSVPEIVLKTDIDAFGCWHIEQGEVPSNTNVITSDDRTEILYLGKNFQTDGSNIPPLRMQSQNMKDDQNGFEENHNSIEEQNNSVMVVFYDQFCTENYVVENGTQFSSSIMQKDEEESAALHEVVSKSAQCSPSLIRLANRKSISTETITPISSSSSESSDLNVNSEILHKDTQCSSSDSDCFDEEISTMSKCTQFSDSLENLNNLKTNEPNNKNAQPVGSTIQEPASNIAVASHSQSIQLDELLNEIINEYHHLKFSEINNCEHDLEDYTNKNLIKELPNSNINGASLPCLQKIALSQGPQCNDDEYDCADMFAAQNEVANNQECTRIKFTKAEKNAPSKILETSLNFEETNGNESSNHPTCSNSSNYYTSVKNSQMYFDAGWNAEESFEQPLKITTIKRVSWAADTVDNGSDMEIFDDQCEKEKLNPLSTEVFWFNKDKQISEIHERNSGILHYRLSKILSEDCEGVLIGVYSPMENSEETVKSSINNDEKKK